MIAQHGDIVLLLILLVVGATAWALWVIGNDGVDEQIERDAHDLTDSLRYRERRP